MGRNRKAGARYPSGKLKPAAKPTADPISGAEWQRIRQHGRRIGADVRLATELSRLNLFGELTIVQTTAGHRVAEIYGRYEALAGLTRSARSPSYERAFGGGRGDSPDREEAERQATDVFLALQATLDELAPSPPPIRRRGADAIAEMLGRAYFARKHRLVDALEQLCVEDRAIDSALYPEMRSLLEELAVRWGLTTVRRALSGPTRRYEPKAAPAAPPPKPKVNADREAWLRTVRALRPDLSEEEIAGAYDMAQAIKQRTKLRSTKKPESPPWNAEARARPKLDRPTLELPGDCDVP